MGLDKKRLKIVKFRIEIKIGKNFKFWRNKARIDIKVSMIFVNTSNQILIGTNRGCIKGLILDDDKEGDISLCVMNLKL